MIDLEKIVPKLLSDINLVEAYKHSMPYVDYVREFRTAGFIGGRQIGKSHALIDYHNKRSSLFLSPLRYNIETWCSKGILDRSSSNPHISSLEANDFVGMNFKGMKYECFCIDDYHFLTPQDHKKLDIFIDRMNIHGMLSYNFHIVTAGTYVKGK